MKILVADDSKLIQNILKDGFEMLDYDVILSSNGKEAFDKTIEFMPDIVILDHMMPKLSGIECAELLRNDENTKNIPIIFLTATRDEEIMLKAMALNVKEFLQKPFNIQEVIEKVEKIIKD